jgi:hypothetical protein
VIRLPIFQARLVVPAIIRSFLAVYEECYTAPRDQSLLMPCSRPLQVRKKPEYNPTLEGEIIMNKPQFAFCLAAPALFFASSSLAAGSKIVGGAEEIQASGAVFSMTVNAISTAAGLKGSIQYSREAQPGLDELSVHATAYCSWISDDGTRAVVAGPAMGQVGAAGGDWF